MKNLTKIIAVVTILSLSCAAAYSAGFPGRHKRMNNRQNDSQIMQKREKPEMTDEQKAKMQEKLKEELAAKLESGEITKEEYDAAISKVESGEFKPDRGMMRGRKGEMPEMTDEQKAKIQEKLKEDFSKKLESGEITKEEYDEAIAIIDSGDFDIGMAMKRGPKGEKPELTDEQKAKMQKKHKEELAKQLESGEISQEQYDEAISRMESGDFRPKRGMMGGRKGKMPPKKDKTSDEAESTATAV